MGGHVARVITAALLLPSLFGALLLPGAVANHNQGTCVYGAGYVHYETTGSIMPGVWVDPPIGPGYWANWIVCASSTQMTCQVYVMGLDGTRVKAYMDRFSSVLQVDYKEFVKSDQFHRDWSCGQSFIEIRLEMVGGLDNPSLLLKGEAYVPA